MPSTFQHRKLARLTVPLTLAVALAAGPAGAQEAASTRRAVDAPLGGPVPGAAATEQATPAPQLETAERPGSVSTAVPGRASPTLPKSCADCGPPARWSSGDWVWAVLAGDAGAALGATVGGALGYAMAGECTETEDPDDESALGPCFLHGLGHMLVGGLVGGSLGAAAGVSLYGRSTSRPGGSYWSALGGFGLGLLAAAAVTALPMLAAEPGEAGSALGGLAVAVLPSLGASIGYHRSAPGGVPVAGLAPGALLGYGPDEGLRPGLPVVGYTTRNGETLVVLSLLSGSF